MKKHHRYTVRNVHTGAVVGLTNCKLLHGLYVEIRKKEGLTDWVSYATFKRRLDAGVWRDLGYTYEMIEIYEGSDYSEMLVLLG
ncbi:hypothetical protein [Runella slithyformis]|uniref:hypothetical protein n=1 Tax=Runella slithyformis TaxID=106 RepID=UPI00146AA4C4|nr:hypothetical protein [Runella slithyformis]